MLMPAAAALPTTIGRHDVTHATRTGHPFLRHLHLHPGTWLKDTRDADFAVGKLIAPPVRRGPSSGS
jgi:hypothetical protein